MSCIMSMNFMIILNHDGDWNCIGSKKGVQIEEVVLTRFYPSPNPSGLVLMSIVVKNTNYILIYIFC